MSEIEKKSYTNHIMNFIIGFFIIFITMGIIVAIFSPSSFSSFNDLLLLCSIGIIGGINGVTVGLIINPKTYKIKTNMVFNIIISIVLGFIFSFIITLLSGTDFADDSFMGNSIFLSFFFIISGTLIVLRTSRAYKNDINDKTKQTTPKSDIKLEPLYEAPVKPIEEKQIDTPIIEKQETKSLNNIEVKSAFSYKGAIILYKIKVENPTPEPIADIKVNLYVPDVFLVSESTKSIAMLKPSESKTATFEIRPTGECGDCEVSGKVIYYDYSAKKTSEIEIPAKNLSIVCPMLHSKEISEDTWRNALSGFAKAEESTKEIEMPASTLFDITTDILQDMNLYMLKPKINDSSNLYRAVAKFYGEGVKELKYAAQIEVVGGAKKSKLILKSWAEREDALAGFYHGILDEMEKRVNVKGYINDSIVQNFHHHGDNIGTQVKDSLVQRSNIGTGEDVKKCPNCNRDVSANEKFCLECGTQIE